MAAAVYYHNDHIKDFLSTYFEDKSSNKLVVCVSHYVNNKVYLAGCRALGIIDKLMTGPLWKQIENAKHILDLNSMWLTFFNYLDEFSRDSVFAFGFSRLSRSKLAKSLSETILVVDTFTDVSFNFSKFGELSQGKMHQKCYKITKNKNVLYNKNI
jgi:hypothetical protein